MKRAGIIFLWIYRMEIISLTYLFVIGIAFAAIWKFHASQSESAGNSLAFEENHRIITVTIARGQEPATTASVPARSAGQSWKDNGVKVAENSDNKPQIAIVIDDLGVVRDKSLAMINMAAPLTLSFLPYAPDLRRLTQAARDRGHELMVHLPMEPKGDRNPGPHALLTTMQKREILQDLAFDLSRFEGYVGINNHMGSAFTEDRRGLDLMLTELHKRGLLVLDSLTSSKSLLATMATERNIPNMTRDVFLDNEQNVDYILAQLMKLEQMAKRRGSAIAIGHPYGETVRALSLWLPTLKQKGIVVVPLSHLVKRKYQKILLAKKDRVVISSTR